MTDKTMRCVIARPNGEVVFDQDVEAWDDFGISADHFEVIAPAYLAPLSDGDEYVIVCYSDEEHGWLAEMHTPNGSRDGKVVGTVVTFFHTERI